MRAKQKQTKNGAYPVNIFSFKMVAAKEKVTLKSIQTIVATYTDFPICISYLICFNFFNMAHRKCTSRAYLAGDLAAY